MQDKGSFGVVRNGDLILMVQLPDHDTFGGHWNFPGGLVEAGETLEAAAKREVLEETAIECEVDGLIETIQNQDHDIEVSIFNAHYVRGTIRIQEEEIVAANWFTVADLLTMPLAYDIKRIIESF